MADDRRSSTYPSEGRTSTASVPRNSERRSTQAEVTATLGNNPVKSSRALFILSEENLLRICCRKIVESKPFEYFILLTIFVNCVFLALNTPLPEGDKSDLNKSLEDAEIYLLAIFCFEAGVKIIALGFLMHPDAYLRSGWNILDFVVVITGILSFMSIMDTSSLKALRAARVLRPLKLVSGIPSLQVVMKSIMCAMVPLLQICLLVGFVIVIYAIVGLEYLCGKFHFACFSNSTNELLDDGILCGESGVGCAEGGYCSEYWVGPNRGITNYDNIFLGMITVFQVITNEGWTDVMYWTFDTVDKHGYIFWMYYVSLVVIGSFFMLNLVLGVLSGEFAKERERVENRQEFLKVRRQQQTERQVSGYLDWILKAEDVMLEEEDSGEGRDRGIDRRNYDRVEDGDVAMTASVLTRGTHMQKGSYRLNVDSSQSVWHRMKKRNRKWKIRVRHIVKHQAFYWLIIVCVFINTVTVATQHYGQPDWLEQFQEITNWVFISFFFMEMCLKIYGLGLSIYFHSQFNTFDCVVVCGGVLEIILHKLYDVSLGISVLRALRLLRLFKFTRYWSSLRNLVTSLLSSVRSILSLLFLLFLFIVIFALLGMQLFGAQFRDIADENPRTNFDNFWNAMLAVFQILTGEDWNAVMYDGVISQGGPKEVGGMLLSLYFVILVILGNYTLLNVFLAIAVDNLANAQQLSKDEEEEAKQREAKKNELMQDFEQKKVMNSEMHGKNGIRSDSRYQGHDDNHDEFEERDDEPPQSITGKSFLRSLKNPNRLVESNAATGLQTNTLLIFTPRNPIRRLCHYIVTLRHFDNFILIVILISSTLLAVEDPVRPGALVNNVLMYFDFCFTSIFASEVLLKLIEYGAIFHQGSYFRDAWNCIDALVVSCAIASLVLSSDSSTSPGAQKIVKVLRVLRVLRPLKAINKAKKLKAVFQCMVYSLKNVLNILIITILFLFIFAVIGVQLFQGKMYHCNDPSKMNEKDCKGYYFIYTSDVLASPTTEKREWALFEFHFNTVYHAMLALFASSTGEGWPALMQQSIDATDVDIGPIIDNKVEISLYYIFFVVVFSFFFLNIFVALIILTFQEQGEKEQGECELDRNQRDCLHFAMQAKPMERFMPEDPNTWQFRIWRLVDSRIFEYFIMILITLNTLILMMKFYDEPKIYRKYLDLFNDIFAFMFTTEAILKLFAFRKNYFRDGWNVFDFIVVLGSLMDFIVTISFSPDAIPFDPSLFRMFRAARLIKLLRQGYTIRILLWTFLQSFKALPYVGMLIGLLFFIYAVIGMQLFGQIGIEDERPTYSEMNRHNNFQTFPQALQVLFRSATGENWQLIMLACTSGAICDIETGEPEGSNCGSPAAYLFFISFIFFCSFLMLNLFVAVIMDNFEYLTRDESILGPHHLDEFVRVWSEYDPGATGRIKHTEVCQLLRQMSPPVGIGKKCPKIVAYKRLIKMNMPLYPDGTVDFTATLFSLVRTSLNIMTEKNNLKENDKELRSMLKRVWPKLTKKTLDKVVPRPSSINNGRNSAQNSQQMTVGKIYCAKLIYENYKFMKKKGKLQASQPQDHHHQQLDFNNLQYNLHNGHEDTANNSNSHSPKPAPKNSTSPLTILNGPEKLLKFGSKFMQSVPNQSQKLLNAFHEGTHRQHYGSRESCHDHSYIQDGQSSLLSRFVGGNMFSSYNKKDQEPEYDMDKVDRGGEQIQMQDISTHLPDGDQGYMSQGYAQQQLYRPPSQTQLYRPSSQNQLYRTPSQQLMYQSNHQSQLPFDNMPRQRYGSVSRTTPPIQHRSNQSLNEPIRAVPSAVVAPHGGRGQPQMITPHMAGRPVHGSRSSLVPSGSQLSLARGDGMMENGYHPSMNQHIAMAIRSGQNPYAIYGVDSGGDEDDWC